MLLIGASLRDPPGSLIALAIMYSTDPIEKGQRALSGFGPFGGSHRPSGNPLLDGPRPGVHDPALGTRCKSGGVPYAAGSEAQVEVRPVRT